MAEYTLEYYEQGLIDLEKFRKSAQEIDEKYLDAFKAKNDNIYSSWKKDADYWYKQRELYDDWEDYGDSPVSVWLTGRGELIFDDTPFVKWNAAVMNSIDYAPERYGRKAILSVSFDVKPFSECIFDTSSGPALDMALSLDKAMPLDMNTALTFSTNTINVINCGTWYVRPTLIFDVSEYSGSFTSLSVECGSKKLSIGGVSSSYNLEKIIIDLEKQTVRDGKGTSLMAYFGGEFFELAPGVNTIHSAGNIAPFKTQVIYTPEFMYDFDMDWGDADA